jgi:peptide/nickel transport system permease protein
VKRRLGAGFRTGAVLVLFMLGLAVTGIFYTPHDSNSMDASRRFAPPGREYFMGADSFGRDVFSRIMTGARYTLLVALLTAGASACIGSALGLFSGYSGGVFDEILMRIMDAASSFPGILLALVMTALLGTGGTALITALLLLFVPGYVRIMRSGALQYRSRDFVRLAEIQGCSAPRILFVHILPNLLPELVSALVLGLGNAILAEATMSYLGLGIQPPVPSWGRMLAESQNYLFSAPWCALAPGFMVMLAVTGFHFLGEGIRRTAEAGK